MTNISATSNTTHAYCLSWASRRISNWPVGGGGLAPALQAMGTVNRGYRLAKVAADLR